ncbi:cell division protein FtsA [Bacilli bacterium PM5-3]|nr:cell division protein FtsA [Bacilli bacterium PM5-3]MDH6603229.1 cell division protein FtsA [Bacilli bacterium PM5-9]
MQHNEIYMCLEVSEYSIKAVVAEYFNSKVFVLASTEKEFTYNEDSDDIKEVIAQVKAEIISLLGYEIKNTILIIPSNHCKKFSDKVKVDVIAEDNVVSKEEVSLGISKIIEKNDNDKDFVASVTIDKYSAYGYGYVSNPVGLEARYIELEASVYVVPTVIAYPLIKLVEEAGFNVVDVCLDIVAISEESIIPSALKTGAIIVDMGFASTNIAHFKNNTLKAYATIELGGKQITNDLALCAQIDFAKAEVFKRKYVNLNIAEINDLVIYRYYDEVNDDEVEITQTFISEVAKSRVEEILDLIDKELAELEIEDGELVYISGGGNNINGLDCVLSQRNKYPYQFIHSNTLGARYSGYVKCLGAIKHEASFSRTRGEIKLFVNKKDYIDSINLVEKNNLLYNSNDVIENDFIKRLVRYIFNN